MNVEEIVMWLFIGCLPAANLYPLFYAFRPWRSTRQGQALMMKALGNVIIIDLTVAFLWFGDYPGRDLLRVVGFSLFWAGINYLLGSLIFSEGASAYPPWSWLRGPVICPYCRRPVDSCTHDPATHQDPP